MNPLDSLLFELHGHELFPHLREKIMQVHPVKPEWKPNSDKEELVYQQGRYDGYKLLLQVLKIQMEEQ